MILAHLARYWLARRRQLQLPSWLASVARSARVLLYYREHAALCRLDVYRNYVMAAPDGDPFHHLSQRAYLATDFGGRERVQSMLSHYRFEETTFDAAYRQAVYLAGGLPLWQQTVGDKVFQIRLQHSARAQAEGELTIALLAGCTVLHRLSFSWIDGALVDVPVPLLPFMGRNQGRWNESDDAFDAFESCFPNNSPSFFCFAAMQGVAQALGMDQVAGVKSSAHVAYERAQDKHFANAYDGFWKILGGVEMANGSWLVALPFYLKPLADMPSKHRKRAAQRREYWRAIGDNARATLQRHLLHARAHHESPAALAEPVEA